MTDPLPTAVPGAVILKRHQRTRLVVNADDFGVSVRINEGIVQAHRDGVVAATSLMAVGGAFEQAVRLCRAVPSLDVGVHLALVAGRPLRADVSSLVEENGCFPAGHAAFVRRWALGRIRRAEVQVEWAAQIERVLDRGIRVTHLDSHQHVHALPGIADLALALARRYRIAFVRAPVEPLRIGRPLNLQGINRMLGSAFLRASWTLARLAAAGPAERRPLRFLGFHDGGRLDRERLRRLIAGLRPGRTYELMCHPGFKPEETDAKSWQYRHEEELQALTDPSIRSEIAARRIQLCSFKDLT
jgi:hopanoid biosynthesis associated protein HpnK